MNFKGVLHKLCASSISLTSESLFQGNSRSITLKQRMELEVIGYANHLLPQDSCGNWWQSDFNDCLVKFRLYFSEIVKFDMCSCVKNARCFDKYFHTSTDYLLPDYTFNI